MEFNNLNMHDLTPEAQELYKIEAERRKTPQYFAEQEGTQQRFEERERVLDERDLQALAKTWRLYWMLDIPVALLLIILALRWIFLPSGQLNIAAFISIGIVLSWETYLYTRFARGKVWHDPLWAVFYTVIRNRIETKNEASERRNCKEYKTVQPSQGKRI